MSHSGTVTLLFTDLVNSTELLSRTGDESAQRIFDAHHKLLSEAVAVGGGHEVKWLGDGLMVAFPSAADAVRCAITMQQGAQRAAGERLSLRVGLHVGEALKKDSDYFGTAVVVARRLCESAGAGQILCSSLVAGLLAGRQAFDFHDLGALQLKGLRTPVPTCEVIYQRSDSSAASVPARHGQVHADERTSAVRRIAIPAAIGAIALATIVYGIARWRSTGPNPAEESAAPRQIRSIAVLPLDNFSGDPGQEYFADGMTDELITDLARISALRVISRTSVMQYKREHRKPVAEIARELNVDAVVEGSVLRVGDRVRITAQLIDAPNDRHLWAKSFERDSRDVLALQDELASAIAREINVQLTPDERARLAGARPVNPEAHEAYLKGRYFLSEPSEERVSKALDHFREAIRKDPNFAPAYSGLADAYLWGADWYFPATEMIPKARSAAERALGLDETLAEAHVSLGVVDFINCDWAGADAEFTGAIRLNPSYAFAHDQYGLALAYRGRFDEAIAESRRAIELDPLAPIAAIDASYALLAQEKLDAAEAELRKALDLDPTFYYTQFTVGWAQLEAGRLSEAIPQLEKATAMKDSPPFVAGYLGYAYAKAGQRHKALAVLAELNAASSHRFVSPFCTAIIYLGLGDKAHALDGLEKAYTVRSWWIPTIRNEKILDPLRSEPRFIELLKKVGLGK
jgi:adenylate cyclase